MTDGSAGVPVKEILMKTTLTGFCLVVITTVVTRLLYASGLDDIARPVNYTSHRVSSFATDGGNADGGQAIPFKRGTTRTIAAIEGAGEISHIWFTMAPFDKDVLANLVLRMYWDQDDEPCVEAPIGAFFGLGHGKEYSFDSAPVSVLNNRGLNCFFPMPFRLGAKITLENQSRTDLAALYYYVDYKLIEGAPLEKPLYFHCQYRQAKPAVGRENYVALEAKGRGHYVGQFYYVRSNAGGWWGEGDDVIYVDGRSLHGTGMEDYFGGAWGMKPGQAFDRFGAPLFEVYSVGDGNENTAYRWHTDDAIAFEESFKFTHEHGSQNDRNDDFFTVAFWYQDHPHAPFPTLPTAFERLSFHDRKLALIDQKRFNEYRELLEWFIANAVEQEALRNARLDLAESYALEGNKQSARDLLQSYLTLDLGEGWIEQVKAMAEKMGIEMGVVSAVTSSGRN